MLNVFEHDGPGDMGEYTSPVGMRRLFQITGRSPQDRRCVWVFEGGEGGID
ncbi:hypothetical protein [Microvirga sp. VF16]|uniref:hypothetical protein n=1 Tax=Microvirga sp. VF16 TaxID=2807101 RepID=UPI00193D1D4F|nr:hypothetical protein [Microvirga sp. VF16]QRM34919.1 hypothetical protein JO965_42425 [Microvirga sp. VF16]